MVTVPDLSDGRSAEREVGARTEDRVGPVDRHGPRAELADAVAADAVELAGGVDRERRAGAEPVAAALVRLINAAADGERLAVPDEERSARPVGGRAGEEGDVALGVERAGLQIQHGLVVEGGDAVGVVDGERCRR